MRKSKSSKTVPEKAESPVTSSIRPRDSAATAREHYHREKARRARSDHPDRELIAAARREYLAMLEADAIKGKGGRPKKKAARPADLDETDEQDESEEPEE